MFMIILQCFIHSCDLFCENICAQFNLENVLKTCSIYFSNEIHTYRSNWEATFLWSRLKIQISLKRFINEFPFSVAAKTMNEYTHVILDEVHERGQEMDFLLLIVKRLLYTVSPGVKVVLMSATFNKQSFADYFMIPTPRGLQMSSCIKIEKQEQMFTVKEFYLNHLTKFGSVSLL